MTYIHVYFYSQNALPNTYYPYTCLPSKEAVVPFLWQFLIIPHQGANPRPTKWEEDLLTTKPTQRGRSHDVWVRNE